MATKISRSVIVCGLVNSLDVRVVVLARLIVGHADLAEHLVLLHARHDHLPLEVLAQIGQRHVFLLERRLELLVGLDVVVLLDAVEDAL